MQEGTEKRSRQQFDDQFKREAVEMMLQSKKSVRQASRELGVHENNLRNWVGRATLSDSLSLGESVTF